LFENVYNRISFCTFYTKDSFVIDLVVMGDVIILIVCKKVYHILYLNSVHEMHVF